MKTWLTPTKGYFRRSSRHLSNKVSKGPASELLSTAGIAHVLVSDIEEPRLSPSDEHHLGTVRRLKPGEVITVGDGDGHWRTAVIKPGNRGRKERSLEFELTSSVYSVPKTSPGIIVGFVLPTLDRASWAVQKMTEVGVDEIHILSSDFSSTRHQGLEESGKEFIKLRKVAREATMQSRRAYLPDLFPLRTLVDFSKEYAECALCTQGGDEGLDPSSPIVVGPEGGFSPAELLLFDRKVALGSNILRSETAAVVVSSVLVMKRDGLL